MAPRDCSPERLGFSLLVYVVAVAFGAGCGSDGEAGEAGQNQAHGASFGDRAAELFVRAIEGAPVSDGGPSRGVAWGDVDGDLDLHLTDWGTRGHPLHDGPTYRPTSFFRNDGGGAGVFPTLTPVAAGELTAEPLPAVQACCADYDLDGDLDVLVTNIAADDRNLLFENDGDGAFTLRDDLPIVQDSRGPSEGHTWGDFDNDGDMDLYVANGTMGTEGVPDFGLENFLHLNRGDGTYLDQTSAAAWGRTWSSHSSDTDLTETSSLLSKGKASHGRKQGCGGARGGFGDNPPQSHRRKPPRFSRRRSWCSSTGRALASARNSWIMCDWS